MFVGIGTGRCGSTSLSKILNQCRDVRCTHEYHPYRVGWIDQKRRGAHYFLKEARGIFGDVAAYWLPHITWLRKHRDVKVIVIQRPKEEFVRSINRVWKGQNYFVRQHKFGPGWDQVIRKTPGSSLVESAGRYWEFYYQIAMKLEDTLWLRTEDLNSDKSLKEVYDYLGIKDRVYPLQRIWNESS